MKTIQITLTESEYHGIRQYLEQDDDVVTSVDIRRYVQNIVTSIINSPLEAVSGYIQEGGQNVK